MKRRSMFLYTVGLICAALCLAGCGPSSTPSGDGLGEGSPTLDLASSEQVLDYNNGAPQDLTGNYDVKISVKSGYLKVGTITSGKLTLNLPAMEAADLLPVVPDTGMVVSDESANGCLIENLSNTFELYQGDDPKGYLWYMSETSTVTNFKTIGYFYLDKDCSITGSYTDTSPNDAGNYFNYTYQVNGKTGWNKMYVPITITTGGTVWNITWNTDMSAAPTDLKWAAFLD
jgi:hypothetical protein